MPNTIKKILFLYSELAVYMLSCMELLAKNKPVEIYIVRWPVNKEAPFKFVFPDNLKVWQKEELSYNELKNLVAEINPDLIYCSGWMDKDYNKICKQYRSSIPVITAFDNKWRGNLKQHIAAIASPFTIKKYFSHCFVPGKEQFQYALKLGFKKEKILLGLYSADVNFYHQHYLKYKEAKLEKFPKRFIYVGRYYEFKGILDLWQAFTELQMEEPNDWELWCLGKGDLTPVIHPKIKHFGFVQLEEMGNFFSNTGIFVLPSKFEPWAVVVHEFTAAGFPLILSDEVGSKNNFLEEGKNGFVFKSGDIKGLKMAMLKMIHLADAAKNKMSDHSVKLAQKVTPENWVETVYSVLKD